MISFFNSQKEKHVYDAYTYMKKISKKKIIYFQHKYSTVVIVTFYFILFHYLYMSPCLIRFTGNINMADSTSPFALSFINSRLNFFLSTTYAYLSSYPSRPLFTRTSAFVSSSHFSKSQSVQLLAVLVSLSSILPIAATQVLLSQKGLFVCSLTGNSLVEFSSSNLMR